MAAKKRTPRTPGGKAKAAAAPRRPAPKPPRAPRPPGGPQVAEGSRAPAFTVPDHEGRPFPSDALAGRPYVLYFYPKADTPGCTVESCGFRDAAKALAAAGVAVVGASPDSPRAQTRFREKHGLPFPLLADEDHALAQAYGVWVEKTNYGRTYMGIERSTFLVGADGRVVRAWRGVRVAGHVEEVLAAARGLPS